MDAIEKGVLCAFAIVTILALGVFVAGETFGQRGERYLPRATEIEQDACVEYLSAGNPVSGLALRAHLERTKP